MLGSLDRPWWSSPLAESLPPSPPRPRLGPCPRRFPLPQPSLGDLLPWAPSFSPTKEAVPPLEILLRIFSPPTPPTSSPRKEISAPSTLQRTISSKIAAPPSRTRARGLCFPSPSKSCPRTFVLLRASPHSTRSAPEEACPRVCIITNDDKNTTNMPGGHPQHEQGFVPFPPLPSPTAAPHQPAHDSRERAPPECKNGHLNIKVYPYRVADCYCARCEGRSQTLHVSRITSELPSFQLLQNLRTIFGEYGRIHSVTFVDPTLGKRRDRQNVFVR